MILSLVNSLLFLVKFILSWDGLMPWWYLGMLWQLKLHTCAKKGNDSKSGDIGISQRSQEIAELGIKMHCKCEFRCVLVANEDEMGVKTMLRLGLDNVYSFCGGII